MAAVEVEVEGRDRATLDGATGGSAGGTAHGMGPLGR